MNQIIEAQDLSYEELVNEWEIALDEKGVVVPDSWDEVGLEKSFYTPDKPIDMAESLFQTFAAVRVSPADIVDKNVV